MHFIELFGDSTFNCCVGIFKTSYPRLQLLAGLLLAVFSLQAAQASYCCEVDMRSDVDVTAAGDMPCHGDDALDDSSDDSGDCCLSCVTIVPAVRATPPMVLFHQANVATPSQLEMLTRQDLPYRPPIYHLS